MRAQPRDRNDDLEESSVTSGQTGRTLGTVTSVSHQALRTTPRASQHAADGPAATASQQSKDDKYRRATLQSQTSRGGVSSHARATSSTVRALAYAGANSNKRVSITKGGGGGLAAKKSKTGARLCAVPLLGLLGLQCLIVAAAFIAIVVFADFVMLDVAGDLVRDAFGRT